MKCNVAACTEIVILCASDVASYPGLPSQLFSQPWKKKRSARGGLGTRLHLTDIVDHCNGREGNTAVTGINSNCVINKQISNFFAIARHCIIIDSFKFDACMLIASWNDI